MQNMRTLWFHHVEHKRHIFLQLDKMKDSLVILEQVWNFWSTHKCTVNENVHIFQLLNIHSTLWSSPLDTDVWLIA